MEAGSFQLMQQWGARLEGVDMEAAREKGIQVANVPATGGNAESVAEHALLLILALLRDLPKAQADVRTGILSAPIGKMLMGRTVCLYGLGAIALPLATCIGGSVEHSLRMTEGCDFWERDSDEADGFSTADVFPAEQPGIDRKHARSSFHGKRGRGCQSSSFCEQHCVMVKQHDTYG